AGGEAEPLVAQQVQVRRTAETSVKIGGVEQMLADADRAEAHRLNGLRLPDQVVRSRHLAHPLEWSRELHFSLRIRARHRSRRFSSQLCVTRAFEYMFQPSIAGRSARSIRSAISLVSQG